MKNIGKLNLKLLLVLVFIFLLAILVPNSIFAANANINTSVTKMQTNESANITVSVADTEAYMLSITSDGGNLSGDTTALDEGNGTEVSKTVMTSVFTASTPGTYKIALTGQITGSDLVKQNVNKIIIVSVVEPIQEPDQPSTPEEPKDDNPQPDQPSTPDVKKSSDASISSLTAIANNKSLDISKDSTKYSATVDQNTTAVTFTIKTGSSKAKIDSNNSTSGIGFMKNSESSGQKTYTISNLKEGSNVIKINIKAEDGTEKNYTFAVTKKVSDNPNEETVVPNIDETPVEEQINQTNETSEEKTDDTGLGLKSLVITGTQISPKFKLTTYQYTATISGSDSVEVIAIPTDEDATVEVVGNKNLVSGENLITVLVKKGDNVKTYQIVLNKTETAVAGATETDDTIFAGLSWKHIAIIVAALLVAIAIILRIATMSKKTIEDDRYTSNRNKKSNRRKEIETELDDDEFDIDSQEETDYQDKKGKRFR